MQISAYPPRAGHKPASIAHPHAVRAMLPLLLTALGEPYLLTGAGDVVRAFDASELVDGRAGGRVEALGSVDGHWHDVTALQLWVRAGEPWVVSASLDGTIRKWRLAGESTLLSGGTRGAC